MIKFIFILTYLLFGFFLYGHISMHRDFVPWWFIPYYKKARKHYDVLSSLTLVIITVLLTLPETIFILALAPFVIFFINLGNFFTKLFDEKEEEDE